jgi:hypothetical protein
MLTSKTNTNNFVGSTRMQLHLLNPNSLPCHLSMVALFQSHDRVGFESTRALVGILALPLPPMGWIHTVDKLLIHLFSIVSVHCMCF